MTEPHADQEPIEPARPPVDEPTTSVYSPTPDRRPEWASPWAHEDPAAAVMTEAPEDGATAPIAAAVLGDRDRRGGGFSTILVTAVLAAALASGGTILALEGSGALRTTGGGGNVPTASGNGGNQPITIDESSAVVRVAAKVSPAVVRIIVSGVSTDPNGQSVPESGVGSGVIYDAAGWILTNRHVVTTADGKIAAKLIVEMKDGRQVDGTVYGVDTLTDLAIVKVDAGTLPVAAIGSSSEIKVGQLAIAIGSPLGTYSNSVTSGIISATGRSVTVSTGTHLSNLIQTDAAINPGNSGGPLLDAAGNVIGINTAMASGSTGIGFAIPIDIARPIMVQAVAGEKLARPYIGIRYQAIDPQLQAELKLSVDHGALIGPSQTASGSPLPGVVPGEPADQAGLKEGDIIVAVEGVEIDREHPLDATLSAFGPGQTVTLKILRGGSTLEVQVTLGTRPADL